MQLAAARFPHLRAMVGAPLTFRDLPWVVGQVAAILRGKEPPKLPEPKPWRARVVEAVTRPVSALWADLIGDERSG